MAVSALKDESPQPVPTFVTSVVTTMLHDPVVLARPVLHDLVSVLLNDLCLSVRGLLLETLILGECLLFCLPGELCLVKKCAIALSWLAFLFPRLTTYVAEFSAASAGC